MAKDDWSQQNIKRFLDTTSEDIINANDKEYLEERIAEGVDVKDVAAKARAALKAGVRQYFLEQRNQLGKPAEQQLSTGRLFGKAPWMNRPVEQLRQLLDSAASKLSKEQAFTLCYRERTSGELQQDEIISALEKLKHLGVVSDEDLEGA